jgi:hypothetical protein
MDKYTSLYQTRIAKTSHAFDPAIHIFFCYESMCDTGNLSRLQRTKEAFKDIYDIFTNLQSVERIENIQDWQKDIAKICTAATEKLVTEGKFSSCNECFTYLSDPLIKGEVNKIALELIFETIAALIEEKLFPANSIAEFHS